jgi:hypothetical protein
MLNKGLAEQRRNGYMKRLANVPLIGLAHFLCLSKRLIDLESIRNGLLPKSFFAGSETFFDKSKARSRRFQNSPFRLKQLETLFFHFAKIYKQKPFQ